MKNLTDAAVISTALDLINKNGKTTTLDVKQALRNDGYFATQSEVSRIMDNLYASNNLEFTTNNGYREYSEAAKYASAGGMSIGSLGSVSNPHPVASMPHIAAVEVSVPQLGDWRVTSLRTPGVVKYYEGASSRGVVRSAFSKALATDYLDTRATVVK